MKIGLGTVQFGMTYGITNRNGQTSSDEAFKTLQLASDSGIRVIDTAHGYGVSEQVLGKILPLVRNVGEPFQIVSKPPAISGSVVTEAELDAQKRAFELSLSRLGVSSLFALLLHRPADLFCDGGEKLYQWYHQLKATGSVRKIGLSIYDAAELEQVIANYDFDIVQLPLNVFDQRLLRSGALAQLSRRNIEIHSRSVFLQGLLLADAGELPAYFESVKSHLRRYHAQCYDWGISPLEAALKFVLHIAEVDRVICGVASSQQLSELLEAASRPAGAHDFSMFAWEDPDLLNPSRWLV